MSIDLQLSVYTLYSGFNTLNSVSVSTRPEGGVTPTVGYGATGQLLHHCS